MMIEEAEVSCSGRDKTNPSTKLLLGWRGGGVVFKREKLQKFPVLGH